MSINLFPSVAARFYRQISKWLEVTPENPKPFKPNRVRVLPNGLASVEKGLLLLKNGEVHGEKLVYRIAETPGLQWRSKTIITMIICHEMSTTQNSRLSVLVTMCIKYMKTLQESSSNKEYYESNKGISTQKLQDIYRHLFMKLIQMYQLLSGL